MIIRKKMCNPKKYLNKLGILLFVAFSGLAFSGCYSFIGGSLPPHLKTLSLPLSADNSGIGNPQFREYLSQRLNEKFRRDNSLNLADGLDGDCQLTTAISTINDQVQAIANGQLERDRNIRVTVEAVFFDTVKNKEIWKKSFSNTWTYSVDQANTARDAAITTALERVSDDIFLAVVSGW